MNRDAEAVSRVKLGLFVNKAYFCLILELLKVDRELYASVLHRMPRAYAILFKQRRQLKRQLKNCGDTLNLIINFCDRRSYEKERI